MSDDQKKQLAGNIAGGLGQASKSVQESMIDQFTKADPQYGRLVTEVLKAE